MPAESIRAAPAYAEYRGNPRPNRRKFAARRRFMLASFRQETSMNHLIFQLDPETIRDPAARLDAMIAAARTDAEAADAEVAKVGNEIAAIEPHPYAHGHTAAGDHAYAAIGPEHFLSLAGLLAQPWTEALARVEAIRHDEGFDYLLKAFPATLADADGALDGVGASLIEVRADRLDGDLTALFARKPMLAVGMVWRLFGFDRRDRDAWVGAFASGERLIALVAATEGVSAATMFGDTLAATVMAHRDELSTIGAAELHARAARRDAERQASWAALPENYRLAGSWRGWSPTKRQRHLMQRIESARGLPMPATARRGASSDAIAGAGGNPRFDIRGGEKA